ncbi:MAG: hypothetical protein ABIP41_02065 [Croceibacterium sp.]
MPVTTPGNWLDMPQTAGDWHYSGGLASFGQPGAAPALTLRCDRAAGVVELARGGAGTGPMTIRTENGVRLVEAAPTATQLVARIAAQDPLLDAIAYSRGRFAVEVPGSAALYIPAWPEVARVIEDCR